MSKLFLTRSRIIDLTEEQTLLLAKYIMIYPNDRLIQIAGTTFTIDEIDLEALRQSKLPQQTKLDIRVKTVEKKTKIRQTMG